MYWDDCDYDKEDEMTGCFGSVIFICLFWMVILLCTGGCKSVKYVSVPEVRAEYVHTTDSIHYTDSIIKEKETTIMMLDSAAMSEYGIKLQAAERAWLVKTKELERELQRIAKMKSDTIIQIDSIPYPVPVPEYIEKNLSWWQKTRLRLGEVLLTALGVLGVIGILKIKKKFL